MLKYLKLIILISFAACSSSSQDDKAAGNVFQENDISTGSGAGLFSKDQSIGVNFSKLLDKDENLGGNFYVNTFLWRASLEVASIAPLISTDAFGGTILTEWYEDPKIKGKRIKIAVFVKSRELRSDGINVKVYIQEKNNENSAKISHDKKLALQIEEIILNKARDLRLKNTQK